MAARKPPFFFRPNSHYNAPQPANTSGVAFALQALVSICGVKKFHAILSGFDAFQKVRRLSSLFGTAAALLNACLGTFDHILLLSVASMFTHPWELIS